MVREILKLGNPQLYEISKEITKADKHDLPHWIMSFPGLLVKLERYKRADLSYLDQDFQPLQMHLEGDLSELLQHEYDHLDGILATMRALDNKSLLLEQRK